MKHLLLTFLVALAATVSSNAQTLQVDPIYVGGTATFIIQNGSPSATLIVGYSLNGSGPYTLSNGLVVDLSMPIKGVHQITLDSVGGGIIGPLPVPSSAVVGLQIWFQGVQIDSAANPALTTTNMVHVTVQSSTTPTGMVAIPGGAFEMGDHAGVGASDEQPVHSVTLGAFYMDKYEVSNTKFVTFLNDSLVSGDVWVDYPVVYMVNGARSKICILSYGIGFNGTVFGSGRPGHPAVYLTWYGATQYCNWLSEQNNLIPCYNNWTFDCDFTANGFRLPTEAEWEYASRGGEHSPYYQYPWGSDSISSGDANYNYNIGTTVNVGSYAANGYGLYNMAGNVWEWCNDWYDSGYYANSPTINPTGPASRSTRVIRGGSWATTAFSSRCAVRYDISPTGGNNYGVYSDLGFRVLAVQ